MALLRLARNIHHIHLADQARATQWFPVAEAESPAVPSDPEHRAFCVVDFQTLLIVPFAQTIAGNSTTPWRACSNPPKPFRQTPCQPPATRKYQTLTATSER